MLPAVQAALKLSWFQGVVIKIAIKQILKRLNKAGAENPEAVAAAAGREALGKERFQKLAAKGLRRYWRKKKGA